LVAALRGARVLARHATGDWRFERLNETIEHLAYSELRRIAEGSRGASASPSVGATAAGAVVRLVGDRSAIALERDGARIEAAFDLGRLESAAALAPDRAAPIAELALTLKSGKPKRLFALARGLLDEAGGGLRLCPRAGLARRRLGEIDLAPERAPEISAGAVAADVFAAALSSAADRLAELHPLVADLRLPEGLHELRVALRRLRAVERLYRDDLGRRSLRRLVATARRLNAGLGPAREWDVFLETSLAPLRAIDVPGLAALDAAAESRRAAAWDDAAKAVDDGAFAGFALDLVEAARRRRWAKRAANALDAPAIGFAATALERPLARLHAAAVGVDWRAPEQRHPLRIRLKELRYAAQLFRGLFPRELRHDWLAAAARLQEDLGALNDASLASALADKAARGKGREAQRAAGFVCGYYAAASAPRIAALEQDFAAFAAAAPFWRGP
jgi:CHAD domain-containing protein